MNMFSVVDRFGRVIVSADERKTAQDVARRISAAGAPVRVVQSPERLGPRSEHVAGLPVDVADVERAVNGAGEW